MDDSSQDTRVMSADEVSRLRERRLLAAAFRRYALRASQGEVEAQSFRVQSLAHFATIITPPDEAQRQAERLLRAAEEFHKACLAVAPDVLSAIDDVGKLKIAQAQSIAAFVLSSIDNERWHGPGLLGSRKSRAAVVADAMAVAFLELTGKEPMITETPGGGPGSGAALALIKEIFRHFGLDDDPESQLREAIERRRVEREATP